jgi:hypothetical protein
LDGLRMAVAQEKGGNYETGDCKVRGVLRGVC